MLKKFQVSTFELKKIEGYSKIINKNIDLYSVSTIENPKNNTLMFINNFTEDMIKLIKKLKGCLILVNKQSTHINDEENLILKVEKPRREYAKILEHIINNQKTDKEITITQEGYAVGKNVIIGKNTIIEPFVRIEENVIIGENCTIKSGAKINKYCVIGNNCSIRENCVIGGEGFGIERDKGSVNYKIPHLGGVKIGDNVEIGALTSIASGTIEATTVDDYVKIDDCVFIAHNCNIGKGTFIIAKAEISGSVKIGKNCWIGPNASLINKISIGDNVKVGIGAVVTKNLYDNSIVAGNPAENIDTFKKTRRMQKKLLSMYSELNH